MTALQPEPLVSIGMPVYNSAAWVRRAIESLQQQTMPDFELIISDNASTDETLAICLKLATEDSRIRVFCNQRNLGVAENYNCVFRHARAEYFKWASSSDLCHPDMLRRCINVLQDRPEAVLAYPRTMLFEQHPLQARPYDDKLKLAGPNPVRRGIRLIEGLGLNNLMNGLFRRPLLADSALMRQQPGSDVLLMFELLLRGPFVEVPDYLFYRSMTAQTCSSLCSREELLAYWDPDMEQRMLFQLWRMRLGYYRAVMSSPLDTKMKWQLTRYLTRSLIHARGMLWKDMILSTWGLMAGRSASG